MLVREVLRSLDLGNSVAEFDEALERYFIETDTFRLLVEDRKDIIAGDKGTGKTALFRILHKRYPSIESLASVEVIPAFNIAGSPVFQRLTEGEPLSEGQYITLWKAFFLSLAGNWVLGLYEDAYTDKMFELDGLLKRTGLRSADDSPGTIFSTIVNLFRRLRDPQAIETSMTITAEGLPIIASRIELGDGSQEQPYVPHEKALGLLDTVLKEIGQSLWLALDRLDEAFAGQPQAEVPALRALFRAYLDLLPFDNIKLKLFVRKDLFRRIIAGGFVNLTHVNARRVEITWDEDSLRHLFYKRVVENEFFMQIVFSNRDVRDPEQVFYGLFPEKVDPGNRKPKTWTWMMGRIRDGNDIKPPRNLIDLVQKAQDVQLRREEREAGEFQIGTPLIASDAIKGGLRALSKQRAEDTLLAEAGTYAELIERFRGAKAEHNLSTLGSLLRLEHEELRETVQVLRDIGFLESVGTNYKIPMLYRDGLEVTQGKAFSSEEPEPDESKEE